MRSLLLLSTLALVSIAPRPTRGCSGRFVQERTFYSEEQDYSINIDYRKDSSATGDGPLLTFRHGDVTLWSKDASAFEDFRSPGDVKISNDGRWLVFGGASVHNMSFDPEYREGLRFYRVDGRLIRFISRLDLPVGDYGVSTSFWYDSERSRLIGSEFHFYTPGRATPLVFELSTGRLVGGELVPGQGHDSHWREWLLRQVRDAG